MRDEIIKIINQLTSEWKLDYKLIDNLLDTDLSNENIHPAKNSEQDSKMDVFKVVLIGGSNCGKSAIFRRWT